MKSNLYYLLLTILFLSSCDLYPQDEYQEQYVVEAYLVADRQLPHIRFSTTDPAESAYSFENTAVANADIEVRLLTAGRLSEAEEIFTYSLSEPGIYNADAAHDVLPLRTYELNIAIPGSDDEISAYTVVPDTFRIKDGVQESIEYQSDGQFEVTITESSYPGRQNIFIFNSISLAPEPGNLTPMYRAFYEDDSEDPEDLEFYANSSSGIINEGNFEINTDGSFTIQYPWAGFTFYEQNLLVANTIDDNVYDYVRSQTVQLGGSSLSPGEIQNVIHNIEGGIGIFGSMASDTTETYVNRPGKVN